MSSNEGLDLPHLDYLNTLGADYFGWRQVIVRVDSDGVGDV